MTTKIVVRAPEYTEAELAFGEHILSDPVWAAPSPDSKEQP